MFFFFFFFFFFLFFFFFFSFFFFFFFFFVAQTFIALYATLTTTTILPQSPCGRTIGSEQGNQKEEHVYDTQAEEDRMAAVGVGAGAGDTECVGGLVHWLFPLWFFGGCWLGESGWLWLWMERVLLGMLIWGEGVDWVFSKSVASGAVGSVIMVLCGGWRGGQRVLLDCSAWDKWYCVLPLCAGDKGHGC